MRTANCKLTLSIISLSLTNIYSRGEKGQFNNYTLKNE